MTASDLTLVRCIARHHAARHQRQALEDDFTSEICWRILKGELPDDQQHRERYIRQTASWAIADYLRKISVTPRRVLAKIKRGADLTPKDHAKIGRVESWDFQQDWMKEIAEQTEPEPPHDTRRLLAAIGRAHPVEFFVLTLHYIHGANLKHIGAVLDVTEARACQIAQSGLALLRRESARSAHH